LQTDVLEGGEALAIVQKQLVITANPNQPVQEINSIIGQIIAMWPGSELEILKAIREEIDRTLPAFEKKVEASV